ncbi:glucosaminidase domain-containing protein [Neobacillus mesonae]|uniref:glucosaminidase domain-containing protein n=1 Tax=Neobacillus mesonae TaxID=1193713 RepID=UPI00203C1F34|nr:glucosaminidase domain-containing protein [Neobacillus mesonae]MCM3567386.1 glucosaminidase domain-containing protein [Neobacillus mesonae]
MSKAKKISSYVLILLLFLQFIPNQPSAYAMGTNEEQEKIEVVLFADEIDGSINLYEGASSTSSIIGSIKDDTAVTVIEEGEEYTLVQYLDDQRQKTLMGYVENNHVVDLSKVEEFRTNRAGDKEAAVESGNEPSQNAADTPALDEGGNEPSQNTADDPALKESENEASENTADTPDLNKSGNEPSQDAANSPAVEEESVPEVQNEGIQKNTESTTNSLEQEAAKNEEAKNKISTFSLTADVKKETITPVVLQGIGLANPTKVYKTPSTDSQELKSYSQGSILKYQTYLNDWYKCTVYINGKAETGYIKVSDVENITKSQSKFKGLALKNPTKIYLRAAKSSDVIKTYHQGSVLVYKTLTSEWYVCTVYINGKYETGYIKASDVENITNSQSKFKGIALKNPTNIYLRAAKSSDIIKTYHQGSVLVYKTLTSEWYVCTVYIKGRAVTGYISKADVENLTNKATTLHGVALKSPTKIYTKASVSSTELKSYPAGTVLKYQTLTSGWYECKVYIKGKAVTGYINVNDVKNAFENQKTYTGAALKEPTTVYEQASKSSKRLKSYDQGRILTYRSFIDGWYSATVYINGKKKNGYIASSDVENAVDAPSTKQVWAKENIKVYSYASKRASVLKSYRSGSELKVETFTSSWFKAKVYVQGKAHTGYISVSDVTTRPYLDLDLRKPANITANDIVNYFNRVKPTSPLKDYAQNFINVQNKYGVNALYLVAHAIWETGWGGSNLIKYKNNLYGYGAYDVCPFTCGYYFPTIEDSIAAVAYKVRTNYLTPGAAYYYSEYGSTLRGMNVRYATDQNWKNGIASLMESMDPYSGKYYSSVSELPLKGSAPSNLSRNIPAGLPYPKDIIVDFPKGISGKIIENVSLRTLPYTSGSTYMDYLSASSEITVLGYNTDVKVSRDYPYDHQWYRIIINGKSGWVYGNSIKIDNLLQVYNVWSNLNIRNQPVDGSKIGSVKANGYLKAVVKDGNPIKQDGWYNVYLPGSTKTGWVSGQFIKEIKN